MDSLDISSLYVSTYIGIHAWEQRILQRLLIDISIPINCSSCNDELFNTIDYDQLCQRITTFVESNCFNLIETVAEKIAQLIKNEFPVSQLSVRVSKPDAIKNAGNISITINR
ncbi:dihydroneopterin aldolase [Legionella oakridgensis]|nr:dihydroneopterin aldolase [Legionella oakridgensis]KTD38688.1 dihydroneopterin aldolase FolB [Legionella oakridgensis]STY20872.1 dihydroneopterin aldolase [Legionella longbeachae]